MGPGLVRTTGPDGGLDQVEGHVHGSSDPDGERSRWADRAQLLVRLLEVAPPGRRHRPDLGHQPADLGDALGQGVDLGLLRQLEGAVAVTAKGSEVAGQHAGPGADAVDRPGPEPGRRFRPGQEVLGNLPLPAGEVALGEQEHGVHPERVQGSGAGLESPHRGPAVLGPVELHRQVRRPHHLVPAGSRLQGRDRLVDHGQVRRVTQGPAVQREPGGEVVRDRRPKPGEGPLGRPPRVHVAAQRGPQSEQVQGVDERLIVRVGASRVARDRVGQLAVDGAPTVLGQVQESGDSDGPQRLSQRRVDGYRLGEKVGRGGPSTGTRGQVGGIDVSPAADLVGGAELGGAEQTYPGGVEVALRPPFPGAAFQPLGDLVIRSDVGVGQVPGPAFGLILQRVGPAEVGPGALLEAGEVHHDRPQQWMAERQRPGRRDPEDPGALTR